MLGSWSQDFDCIGKVSVGTMNSTADVSARSITIQ